MIVIFDLRPMGFSSRRVVCALNEV